MNLKNLNLKYALVNIGFLMTIAGTLGYAYNFLSQNGFADGTIGTIMTAINLLGVLAGPAAGDIVDRSEKLTQKMFISGSMVICFLGALALLLVPAGSAVIIPLVIITFMSASIGMPLLNSMAFIYERVGGVINYGLGRGLGSAAYAVGSTIVGRLWSVLGTRTLPVWVIVGSVFTFLTVNLMPNAPKGLAGSDAQQSKKNGESITILQFFGKYRDETIVALALVLMYLCHFIINNYMAKVVGLFVDTDVETVQGNAMFIAAMLELPMMSCFSLILKRFSVNQVMVFASIVFSIKHVLTFMATNVPMFYFTMTLQMLGYAALVPAAVYFANDHVAEADLNKGQAVFTVASSVGGLLASFLGGWLFGFIPVRAVLGLGAACSVCGTLLLILMLRKMSGTSR